MQHKAVTIPEEAAELSHRRTLSNSFRIVDLNNKESSFMLLKMMKQEERRRLEKQSSLQKTLLKKTRSDENSLPFCLSSSSGSSFSSASTPQSPTQSLNTSFNSNASYCMMSSSDAFLNATYPPYRRINNSPNFSTETVSSTAYFIHLTHIAMSWSIFLYGIEFRNLTARTPFLNTHLCLNSYKK